MLALDPLPKVLWMQQGVRHDETAARAEAAGLRVVMNRCPKIEYGRLSGEIGWTGVNSRTISAKRPQRLGTGVQRLSLTRTRLGQNDSVRTDLKILNIKRLDKGAGGLPHDPP